MLKVEFKEQVSALIKVGGKQMMFSQFADSEEKLLAKMEKHGMGLSDVVSFKTFKVDAAKRRGRTKSKY